DAARPPIQIFGQSFEDFPLPGNPDPGLDPSAAHGRFHPIEDEARSPEAGHRGGRGFVRSRAVHRGRRLLGDRGLVAAVGELSDADYALVDRHAEALLEEFADVAREVARLGTGPDEDVDLARVSVDVFTDERAAH